MAYVGTPRYLGDDRTTIASILQGEARAGAPQIAVANVIQNRADANFGGYGGDVLSQATARSQFQGQVPVGQITPQSYATADQLLGGTLPRTLPDSLNYAAPVYSGPGATTAGWAKRALSSGEGVNIGGNVFFKDSSGGTPTYNPSASAQTNGQSASADGTTAKAGGMSFSSGGTAGLDMTGAKDNGDGTYTLKDGTTTLPEINSDDPAKGTPAQAAGPGSVNSGATTSGNDSGSGGSGGFGAFMTDVGRAVGNALAPATVKAGQAQASATTQAGTTVAKGATDAAGITAAQSKASDTLFSNLSKDYFGRFVIILLGLIFVAGGVAIFVFNKNPVTLATNAVKKVV